MGVSDSDSPTTPWNQKGNNALTSPWAEMETGSSGFTSKAAGIISNPDSIVSGAVGMAAKGGAWVALAYAIIKTGMKVYDTCLDFSSLETGDYSKKLAWDDGRQAISHVLTPFSSTYNYIRTRKQMEITDNRKTLERELLGDSVINSYSNRGV